MDYIVTMCCYTMYIAEKITSRRVNAGKSAEIRFSSVKRGTRAAFLLSHYARLHEYAKIHRGILAAHFSPNNRPAEQKKATI